MGSQVWEVGYYEGDHPEPVWEGRFAGEEPARATEGNLTAALPDEGGYQVYCRPLELLEEPQPVVTVYRLSMARNPKWVAVAARHGLRAVPVVCVGVEAEGIDGGLVVEHAGRGAVLSGSDRDEVEVAARRLLSEWRAELAG